MHTVNHILQDWSAAHTGLQEARPTRGKHTVFDIIHELLSAPVTIPVQMREPISLAASHWRLVGLLLRPAHR